MKAIRFHAYGGPEVLRLEEIPVPEAQPGEVLIRVQAAGVNFLDAYQRMGLYKTPLPFVPGMEGSGFIEKSEPEARLKPGTRSGVGRTSRRLRAVRSDPCVEGGRTTRRS
jgi:NADPH:quinone reductase